jgi:hypothetical protein
MLIENIFYYEKQRKIFIYTDDVLITILKIVVDGPSLFYFPQIGIKLKKEKRKRNSFQKHFYNYK